MRVLVCGSRGWQDYLTIYGALMAVKPYGDAYVTIVHGAARGADSLAEQAAEALYWPVEAYPADWDKHGKAAGPIRNKRMLDSGIDLVLAFTVTWPPTPGTANMIKIAAEAGVPARIYVNTK